MYHRIFKRRKRSKEKERNRGIEKKMDGEKQKYRMNENYKEKKR